MAAVLGDFPDDEKSDSITFAVSHTIVMIKILSVLYNKELVKRLNSNMVRLCETHEDPAMIRHEHTIIKINIVSYFITVYGSAACFIFEGLRKMKSGSHFTTIVTYYPSFENDSIQAMVFRIYTTLVLLMMMLTMISIDTFAMVHLIMYKYKFITLRNYFDRLRIDFEKSKEHENQQTAVDNLTQGVVDGIVMHEELLRISKDFDQCFGTVLAVQVFQSSGSAVSLLLQIALSDQLNFVASMKIIFFGAALFFLLGLFLCNAGEITHQAALISDAVFYCGWHECPPQRPPRRNLGRLVLQTVVRAQRPLVMKAFKMLELTYGTFILVLRGTYSVFALFYAQNE